MTGENLWNWECTWVRKWDTMGSLCPTLNIKRHLFSALYIHVPFMFNYIYIYIYKYIYILSYIDSLSVVKTMLYIIWKIIIACLYSVAHVYIDLYYIYICVCVYIYIYIYIYLRSYAKNISERRVQQRGVAEWCLPHWHVVLRRHQFLTRGTQYHI